MSMQYIANASIEILRRRLEEAESKALRATSRPFPFSGPRARVAAKAVRERNELKAELMRRG